MLNFGSWDCSGMPIFEERGWGVVLIWFKLVGISFKLGFKFIFLLLLMLLIIEGLLYLSVNLN